MTDARGSDDWLTIASIAALAYVSQDVLHEGLGHGVTAWLSGAQKLTMSTVALQSDISTRWISANGTLVNLAAAFVLWLLLLKSERYSPQLRFFFIMALAGNLFTGTGYFLFSGVLNFGDWAQVIKGLEPHWAWRVGLVVVGAATYYGSVLLVAAQLRAFLPDPGEPPRLRRLTWIPYFAEGVLAFFAGVLNPAGLFYVIAAALPSTLGANAGLLSLPSMMRGWERPEPSSVPIIRRSPGWIAAAVVICGVFIGVIGRGVTWTR
ncbi:MAG TPA: hypothetical protein VMU28_03335 [Terriglobales bacterium]|nr:hypothetical protein [Terriglobales bacterium]